MSGAADELVDDCGSLKIYAPRLIRLEVRMLIAAFGFHPLGADL